MASGTSNKFREGILNGTINLSSDTIKVMLLSSQAGSYVFNPDNDFLSSGSPSATSCEFVGTGYAGGFSGAGRKTLSNKSIVKDNSADVAYFDNTVDTTWTAISGQTISFAIVYKSVTADTDSIIIAVIDVTDLVTNGSDVTLQYAADGVLKIA